MRTFGILAASLLCVTLLCVTSLSAQHASGAAAKSASPSTAAARPAPESKPAPKPAPAHAPAAKPVQRVTDVKLHRLPERPIKRRSTVYWRNFCLSNPYAAVCQEQDSVAQQSTPAPGAPTVILDPYAPATLPAAPKSMLVNPTLLSAPAQPIVKVSDELAATVSVGASQADIRQKLGQPHSMISGGPERYTYFLQSGGSLQLDFEDGRVTQVRNTNN
jgi:hypothetical protein